MKLEVGDEVSVREPERFEPGCVSITGHIIAIDGDNTTLRAYVCHPWVKGVGSASRADAVVMVPLRDCRRRIGTPISALSGRPGHQGFGEFARIAKSWGYD